MIFDLMISLTRRRCCWLLVVCCLLVGACDAQQPQPSFQQGVMPSGLMAGVQDCPTNILFSIVATCTSIQSQLPTLVERLRDAIRIQEESNDFSPSDIAKMRETSTGLCEMADPMLSCLKLLGQCPSLLGSLGSGVDDARGVLQVMCVNRSLDRYLDCTERNGGMNIRQRYCSQYRNYTIIEALQPSQGQNGDGLRSTISSLASFQGISGFLNEGSSLPGDLGVGGAGIAGLMGPNGGPKTSLNCPVFTLFSGCMASAVKKVCGREESESMYYVSQIQAKTSADGPCKLPATVDLAESAYLQSQYRLQGSTNRPTPPVPVTQPSGGVGASRTPRVRQSTKRPTTAPTTVAERAPPTQLGGQQDTTSFWMPNRLRQQQQGGNELNPAPPPQPPSAGSGSRRTRPTASPPTAKNNNQQQPWWWQPDQAPTTPPTDGKNVIVLQLATTPDDGLPDNAKVSSELRQNAFDWSDDDDASFGGRRGENAAAASLALPSARNTALFVLCINFALSALLTRTIFSRLL